METKAATKNTETTQQIQLVKGEFTHSEASQVINALIDQKINFHKMQRLQNWEGNHSCETSELDGRIKELENEKQAAKQFLAKIKDEGLKLKMDGVIEIGVVK